MKIHDFVQKSPEWYAHRRTHFNASDAPAMMGCSPYKTRAQLLREMHTGLSQDVDAATQRRFDDGHRFEALARPLAEKIIDADLYPVTGSEGKYSASFDGLTMDDDIGFEHKTLNDELRAAFNDMLTMEPEYSLPVAYRVQMEHQLLVSGASKILFMASKWNGDTLVEEKHCWYYPDMNLRRQIIAGWQQFEQDLIEYKPEPAADPVPTGRAPETLPALLIEVTGQVTSSNLNAFKTHALAVFASINRELTTDEQFADAEKTVKWCGEVEDKLKAAKEHALSQTASIDALFKTIDDISAEARKVRLDLDKLVKARKESIRVEIVGEGNTALRDHVMALNTRLGNAYMPTIAADFAGVIRGKKNLSSMRDAVATELARAKIEASRIADLIDANIKAIPADKMFLFPDLGSVCTKAPDDFDALLSQRYGQHLARQEQERERIRAEEAEKVAAKLQREAQAPAPAPPANVVPMHHGHAAVSKPVDDGQMIPLGKINARLGFSVTADFLWELGFQSKQEKNARLYPESQFPAICAALIRHIQEVSVEKIAA